MTYLNNDPLLPLALAVTFTWWAVMDITAPNGIVLRPNHFSSNPFGSLLFLSILFFWLIRKGHNPHKRKNQLIIQLPLKFKRITSLNDRNLARCESSIKTTLKELLVNFSTKICDLRPSIAAKKSSKIRTKRRFKISCLGKVVDPYISRTPTQSSVVMTTKYFVGTRPLLWGISGLYVTFPCEKRRYHEIYWISIESWRSSDKRTS